MVNIPTPRGYSGVFQQTIDLSSRISPSAAINVGAILPTRYGPAETITDFSDETTLVKYHGTPDNSNFEEFYNITRIWNYRVAGLGANIKVVRPVNSGSLNGGLTVSPTEVVTASTPLQIKNRDEVSFATIVFDDTVDSSVPTLKFHVGFPTDANYKIALANATDFPTTNIKQGVSFIDNFDIAPEGTEVAICVLDENDEIIDSEKWIVDLTPGNVDGYGQDTFIENVINTKSNYIFAFYNDASGSTNVLSFEATPFVGGVYVPATVADMAVALDLFSNPDSVDINYLLAHPSLHAESITLCESRGDCVFRGGVPISNFLGVDETTALSNALTYSETTLSTNTTFGGMGVNALYILDTYNNKRRWINVAGDLIGLRVQQNLNAEPWFSDAYLNYGQIKECIKIAQNWSPNSQIKLKAGKLNPIILKPGKGIIKSEQNCYTSKVSALRAENVRELVNYIWRAGRVFLEYQLHEFNDEVTRGIISSQMNRFLQSVQDGRGIRKAEGGGNGYRVVCDESNNTDDVISQEMLIIDIAFLPARITSEIHFRMSILDNSLQLEFF